MSSAAKPSGWPAVNRKYVLFQQRVLYFIVSLRQRVHTVCRKSVAMMVLPVACKSRPRLTRWCLPPPPKLANFELQGTRGKRLTNNPQIMSPICRYLSSPCTRLILNSTGAGSSIWWARHWRNCEPVKVNKSRGLQRGRPTKKFQNSEVATVSMNAEPAADKVPLDDVCNTRP